MTLDIAFVIFAVHTSVRDIHKNPIYKPVGK